MKQITAALLLWLFVIIHVVKLLHHHPESGGISHRVIAGKAISTPSFHCAVCDYQFVTDADAVTAFAQVTPPLIHNSIPSFFLLPFTTSIGLPSADRGPPAAIKC